MAVQGGVAALGGWRRPALAAGLGALAAAALPPVHAVVALVPAFTGLVWLVDARRGLASAFAVGWWFGLGHFVAGLHWVALALLVQPERFAWMIPFAVFGLAAVLAVFTGAATLLTNASRTEGAGRILFLAAAWVAGEWLRGWVLTGFPWNLVGTAWVFSEAMVQLAALTGVWGLSLLSVALAAMPALLAAPGRHGPASIAVACVVLAAVWGGGAARLASVSDATQAGVRLRLVQPNIPQALKWRPQMRRRHLETQVRMSIAPAATGAQPTHVIWAETAATFYLERDAAARARVAAAAPAGGLVIVGAPRIEAPGRSGRRVFNSLHAIDPEGRVVGTYDKFHLVPFGEYVPFRAVLDIAKITLGRTDFSPGPGARTLRLDGLPPLSPLICYEAIFPGRVLDGADRPAWMLNITNDAWFGNSVGPYQHFAAARLRAVEEGLPLVRVANTGISAVVDAYGRTWAALGLGRAGVLDSPLPAPLESLTPFARLGEWMIALLLAAAAAGGLATRRRGS